MTAIGHFKEFVLTNLILSVNSKLHFKNDCNWPYDSKNDYQMFSLNSTGQTMGSLGKVIYNPGFFIYTNLILLMFTVKNYYNLLVS